METKKRGKRRLVITIIVVVVVLGCVFLSTSSGILPDVFGIFGSKQIQVRIGYSKFPYPPLHYKGDSGELIGFDIDLATAAGEIMNAEIEFIPIDWTSREELLVSGEVDMLWGGLERTSLDTNIVKFTQPYLRSNIVLLMNDDRDYAAFEDLQGLNICALNFTPAYYYLKVYDRDVIKSQRAFTPPDYHELTNSMSSGDFDCMVTDTSFASFYQKITGTMYRVSESLMGSNYAVAVRIDDTALFDKLQAALDQLETDGVITDLYNKWIAYP